MIDSRLIDYIKEQKNKGYSDESILKVLLKSNFKKKQLKLLSKKLKKKKN
jgi:hypothetical protein